MASNNKKKKASNVQKNNVKKDTNKQVTNNIEKKETIEKKEQEKSTSNVIQEPKKRKVVRKKESADKIEEKIKNIENLLDGVDDRFEIKEGKKANSNSPKTKKVEKKNSENKSENKTENKSENKVKKSVENKKEISKDDEDLKAAIKAANDIEKDSKTEIKTKKKGTEIVKKDSVEILEKEIKENKNKKSYFLFNFVLITVFLMIFSTIFAILNQNNGKIIKGIKIKDIDVSNLSIEEAKTKITEAIELEFMRETDIYYSDEYKVTFKPVQIESNYNIDEAVNNAYKLGRTGNIIIDNYQILFTGLTGKEVEIDFEYNEDSLKSIVEDISSKIPNKVIDYNYSIEENELIITEGTKGVRVNSEKLKNDILDDVKSRNVEEIIKDDKKGFIQIEAKEEMPHEIDIEKIYNEIKCDPVDAYYEMNPFKLYPESDGIDFAISIDEAKKIIASGKKDEYVIPIKRTPASKTINDIGTEAFPYLISSYSTKYDASNTNRSKNLELAASKINGIVIMPGEEFSYNKVVGKRTVEAGYKNAKIYSNGQVNDGLGGGICQISSTLYNAVLMADLEIVERRNHSFKTSYVAAGRDATVVWGSIDFKFKNTRTYPIKIEASVSNGIAEFKIHGIKEEKEYEIKILPVVTQTIPFGTQEVIDPTMAPGTSKVTQSGSSGCKVSTYIEKRLDGKVISKDIITSDYYKPMTKIIKRAP